MIQTSVLCHMKIRFRRQEKLSSCTVLSILVCEVFSILLAFPSTNLILYSYSFSVIGEKLQQLNVIMMIRDNIYIYIY